MFKIYDIEFLDTLKTVQDRLDCFISMNKIDAHTSPDFRLAKQRLALIVELAELTQELQTLKHWEQPLIYINKEKAVEEYIKGLQIFLSICNLYEIDFYSSKYSNFCSTFALNTTFSPFSVNEESLDEVNMMLNALIALSSSMEEIPQFYNFLMIFDDLGLYLDLNSDKVLRFYNRRT